MLLYLSRVSEAEERKRKSRNSDGRSDDRVVRFLDKVTVLDSAKLVVPRINWRCYLTVFVLFYHVKALARRKP